MNDANRDVVLQLLNNLPTEGQDAIWDLCRKLLNDFDDTVCSVYDFRCIHQLLSYVSIVMSKRDHHFIIIDYLNMLQNIILKFDQSQVNNLLSELDSRTISSLLQLLSSYDINIIVASFLVIIALLNIDPQISEIMISSGIISCIHRSISVDVPMVLLQQTSEVMLHLIENMNKRNESSLTHITEMCRFMDQLLRVDDPIILENVCRFYSFVPCIGKKFVFSRIIQLMTSHSSHLANSAVEAIGNIIMGAGNHRMDLLVRLRICKCIKSLLDHHNSKGIIRMALLALSKVASGEMNHKLSIRQSGLLLVIINYLDDTNYSIKIEAWWAFSNFVNATTVNDIICLLNPELIARIIESLRSIRDTILLAKGLQSIKIIFYEIVYNHNHPALKTDRWDRLLSSMEDYGGLDRLQEFATHADQDANKLARDLVQLLNVYKYRYK